MQGFSDGILGSTLPDLQLLTSSTTAQISTIFTWRAVASIPGSLLIGQLFDSLDGMAVMAAMTLPAGIFTVLIPWCPNLIGMGVLNALAAIFTSGIVTGRMLFSWFY